MPPIQRGQAYRLGPNKWGLRYYDAAGERRRKSPFPSKSAALQHYRDVIEPQLRGEPAARAELTLAEFVPMYLERHATAAFGDVPLRELERMTNEVAAWRARLPERAGHGIAQALRQVLDAAIRWEYMSRNPAKLAGPNRKPPARTVRAFTHAEIDAIGAELAPAYATLPAFAA